jgi:hypothetical protein
MILGMKSERRSGLNVGCLERNSKKIETNTRISFKSGETYLFLRMDSCSSMDISEKFLNHRSIPGNAERSEVAESLVSLVPMDKTRSEGREEIIIGISTPVRGVTR